jgi:hypothetical protein
MNPSRKHAYTDAGIPQLPQPTYAERVRTLVSLSTIATLSTVSRKQSGYPFGSLMPFAIDGTGRPIFRISNMAMHTQNIQADARASLFVGQVADGVSIPGRCFTKQTGDMVYTMAENSWLSLLWLDA